MRWVIKNNSCFFLIYNLESNIKFKMCSPEPFLTVVIIVIYNILLNIDQSKSSKRHRGNEVFSWNSDLTGFTTSILSGHLGTSGVYLKVVAHQQKPPRPNILVTLESPVNSKTTADVKEMWLTVQRGEKKKQLLEPPV